MFFMARISDGGQELGISVRSADIFGRTGIFTVEAPNAQSLLRVAGVRVFDDHDMVPAVAEVVEVVKTSRLIADGLGENDSLLIELLELLGPVRIVGAVAFAAENELMQVAIGPAHAGLQDVVQPRELQILGNEQSSPNPRGDFQ